MSTNASDRLSTDAPLARPGEVIGQGLERLTWLARESLEASVAVLLLADASEPICTSSRPGLESSSRLVLAVPAELVFDSEDLIALSADDDEISGELIPSEFRSYLGAPVIDRSEGRVYGVLAVVDERLRRWDKRDRGLLRGLAEAVASEIGATGVAEELAEANARLHRVRTDLEKERVQLREMIRMAPAFIASVEGPNAVFTMANDPFYQLVGARDLIGRPMQEALSELVGQGVFELVGRVYRSGQSLGGEETKIRLRNGKDGLLEDRFVSFVYQPLIGPKWEVKGVLVCGVDLTEQVRARKAAEAAASDFRLMAETIHQVFWIADASGEEISYVSPSAEHVWGRPKEDLIAEGWIESISEEDRDRVRGLYTPERLQAGKYDAEYRIVLPDESVRWIRDRAYPVRDEAGSIYRIVGIAEDVTERRALEMQLRQSQKMEAIGRLAGGIAHDFNNMLTAISGHAQLIESELPQDSGIREHVDVIRMAADRSAGLTRQLLAFSRKQILQPRIIDLNDVVRSMEPMLRRMIGEDIGVHTSLQEDLPAIYADPGQIEQVLMNLIVNARDAMPGGGSLTLTTKEAELSDAYFKSKQVVMTAGRYAMLGVSDTGIGMDRITEARIFEPFFTTKPAGEGTGLGLSTVYGIVKQTQGFVWVYSEPGQGTTFKVYLPLAPVRGQTSELPEPASGDERISGTILVVEDDDSVRSLVTRVLRRAGFEVMEAGGAPAAAAVSADFDGSIDLLLTDVVLPTLSGRAVSEMIRNRHPEARVLYMSGYTDEAIVRHGVLDAGTEFIEKPFTPERLLAKVSKILRKPLGS